jgi:hypothetical protein
MIVRICLCPTGRFRAHPMPSVPLHVTFEALFAVTSAATVSEARALLVALTAPGGCLRVLVSPC